MKTCCRKEMRLWILEDHSATIGKRIVFYEREKVSENSGYWTRWVSILNGDGETKKVGSGED